MIDAKNITGIILAGGKSSRMGEDKGLIEFNNKPFIKHIIDAVTPLVSETIIVSNNPDHDVFGLKRIKDDIENSGPMAGIHSGLKSSNTEYNLVLSCDVPLINTDVLKMLINTADDNADIIQIESQGRSMPLIALYKKKCETVFYKLLLNGERRLHIAVSKCNSKSIVLDSDYALYTTNINTPEQLKNIEPC